MLDSAMQVSYSDAPLFLRPHRERRDGASWVNAAKPGERWLRNCACILPVLAHATRAMQVLFATIEKVDTLGELARVRKTAVALYYGYGTTRREIMRPIEPRAVVLGTQVRLFPAAPVEAPPGAGLEPVPTELVREWRRLMRTMGPHESDAIELLTHKQWERASLRALRCAIEHRRRQPGA
jgi:hypothetical protein